MSSEIDNQIFDLKSELEDVRITACRILFQIGDETAISSLREATKDESPAVRYFAGKALNCLKERLKLGLIPTIRKH